MYKQLGLNFKTKTVEYSKIVRYIQRSLIHKQTEEAIVEIKYGKLKGRIASDYKGGKYYSFQGIPYAKPPIGDLRFKSPLPPEKWKGIRDATKLGNMSLSQHIVHREKIVGSEDCLYLNVYTSNIQCDKTTPKPVMFWIHGGALLIGSGNTDFYGPEHLITGDVVIITINYRLGMLGFLSLEDPSLGVPGNTGLKDMVKALKWVKENIEYFGGDPKNVTIFGESAGSVAVHLLMCSPMAKGLFHRAIMQSGAAYSALVWSRRISTELYKILKTEISNERDLLEYLLKIPSAKFINIQMNAKAALIKSSGFDEMQIFRVVTEIPSPSEINFITQHPWDIFASNHYNKVPLMIGYAKDEGLLTELEHIEEFGSLRVPKDLSSRIPHIYNIPKGSELSKYVAERIRKFYFGNKQPSNGTAEKFLKLETDVLFYRGIFVAMRQFSNNLNLPIYMYRFSADTKLNLLKAIGKIERRGTCHSDILGYLFTTDYTPKFDPKSPEAKIVENLVTMWTNFAKSSNPNCESLEVTWKPVERDCHNFLDIGNNLIPEKSPDEDRMKFWDEIANDPAIKSNF